MRFSSCIWFTFQVLRLFLWWSRILRKQLQWLMRGKIWSRITYAHGAMNGWRGERSAKYLSTSDCAKCISTKGLKIDRAAFFNNCTSFDRWGWWSYHPSGRPINYTLGTSFFAYTIKCHILGQSARRLAVFFSNNLAIPSLPSSRQHLCAAQYQLPTICHFALGNHLPFISF